MYFFCVKKHFEANCSKWIKITFAIYLFLSAFNSLRIRNLFSLNYHLFDELPLASSDPTLLDSCACLRLGKLIQRSSDWLSRSIVLFRSNLQKTWTHASDFVIQRNPVASSIPESLYSCSPAYDLVNLSRNQNIIWLTINRVFPSETTSRPTEAISWEFNPLI